MSLIFYNSPMSTASITELVLAELDVPCEKVRVDLKKGETRTPDYLLLNPNGKVPLLVHDGVSIWESAAITLYLGETFGVEKKLYPPPGTKRGEAMKWIAWGNVTLAEPGVRLSASLSPGNAGAAEKARVDLAGCLKILDDDLAGKQFLLGGYSLADTHLCSIVGWLGMMRVDMQPFANVTGWMQRCGQRPVFARMMAG